jgi:uncharacterized protein YtpQ (UPF0354 family)
MRMEEYERDCKLDKDNLDVEWERQASLFMKWSERYAQAVSERMLLEEQLRLTKENSKRKLEEVRATLDFQVRSNPQAFGLDSDKKPTETAIQGVITLDESYKLAFERGLNEVSEATKRVAEAVENENILDGAKRAMDHKRSAADGLTRLWLGGFYAEVKVPNEARERVEREAHKQIGELLKNSPRLRQRIK